MRKLPLLPLAILAACGQPSRPSEPAPAPDPALVAEARRFVADADQTVRKLTVEASLAAWANETDLTPEHEAATARASELQSFEITKLVKRARKFDPILAQLDPDTRRQLVLLKFQAQPSPDDPQQAKELAELAAKMDSEYGKGVCKAAGGKATCQDIEYWSKLLQKDRTPDQLLAAWKTWHDDVGHKERDLFVKYVELANAGARHRLRERRVDLEVGLRHARGRVRRHHR